MRHRLLLLCLALLALAIITAPSLLKAQGPPQQAPAGAQQAPQGQRGGRGGRGAEVPSKPTPRWTDGRPRVGAGPDEKGIWGSCCGSLSFDSTPNPQVNQNPGAAAQAANAPAGRGRGGAPGFNPQANQPPRTET